MYPICSLHSDSPLDVRIKSHLMSDIFNLAGFEVRAKYRLILIKTDTNCCYEYLFIAQYEYVWSVQIPHRRDVARPLRHKYIQRYQVEGPGVEPNFTVSNEAATSPAPSTGGAPASSTKAGSSQPPDSARNTESLTPAPFISHKSGNNTRPSTRLEFSRRFVLSLYKLQITNTRACTVHRTSY